MMKRVVLINRNLLFSSASYSMIINVTRVGSLTISSAGITVCSLLGPQLPGWMNVCSSGFIVSTPL